MISRQTQLRPLLRCFAAATLLLWIVAQACCFAHCTFGVSLGGSGKSSCHDSALTKDQPDEGGGSCCPKNRDRSTGVICATMMKAALAGSGSVELVQPDVHLLYALAPFVLALNVTVNEPTTVFFRQATPSDWVFTPELSLGPAHRSHAPPFLG